MADMIKVLQNWQEIGVATLSLQRDRLPTHLTVQKNWDQWLLKQTLADLDWQPPILDLGCGDCCTLDFLAALGFANLHGIDLHIKPTLNDRPYKLYEGDLTSTPFPDQTYDVAVSISVIEHGVDLHAFFREAQRLLKVGGRLFVTTDYWEQPRSMDDTIKPFGLSWSIFSRADIQHAINLATHYNFGLLQPVEIPACTDETVFWHDQSYTFIAVVFEKQP